MGKLKTHEQFLEDFKLKSKHYDNIKVIGKYNGDKNPIECKCKVDGYIWYPLCCNLLSNHGCPICSNNIIVSGKNDMWTKNKELAKLLLNSEDGYKYGEYSNVKLDWKCPNCGNIINNKKICNVNIRGLSCNICSDGISLPNKFIANLLNELDIIFETEKIFEWCNFVLNNKNKYGKYDFYFKLNNKKYIIEADGGFHDKLHSKSKLTLEDIQFIDLEKDRLAKENGYIMIRIDCEPSEFKYIKNNIINSELNNLFNLSIINWDLIYKNSLKSIVIEVCKLWDEGINPTDISRYYKLGKTTVYRYLNYGANIGFCNYVANPIYKYNLKERNDKFGNYRKVSNSK